MPNTYVYYLTFFVMINVYEEGFQQNQLNNLAIY
jgi:hypothetical protein